jgi:antitoxin component YwqK of YwqJK toxin-antitoxin module
MKKSLILVLGLLMAGPSVAAAQQVTDLGTLVRRGGVLLDPRSFEPFSGPVQATWEETGQIREKGTLRDGRWDGMHEWYHMNGELSTRETYASGRLDGPSQSFFKNGTLSVSETYRNGQLDGPYEAYWTRGWLAEKGMWEDGEPCGDWLSFGRNVTYPACRASQN